MSKQLLVRWVGPGFSSAKDKETVYLDRVPNIGEMVEFSDDRLAEVTNVYHFAQTIAEDGNFVAPGGYVACLMVATP
jgi:hypothetical protein